MYEKQDNESLFEFLKVFAKKCDFIYIGSRDADLRDLSQTEALFEKHKPTHVIHCAAKVGGLFANMSDKVGFYEDNMMINFNMIKTCHKYGVNRLVCLLSTCVWPDKTEYPLTEKTIHDGAPHPSNEGYAYAKRMAEIHCRLYNEQYGTDFVCVVPCNLYGPHDAYGPRGHVVANFIERAFECKQKNSTFTVWGSGRPLRQFCFARDLC